MLVKTNPPAVKAGYGPGADHGKRIWRVHTGTRRDEQHGQGRNNSDS